MSARVGLSGKLSGSGMHGRVPTILCLEPEDKVPTGDESKTAFDSKSSTPGSGLGTRKQQRVCRVDTGHQLINCPTRGRKSLFEGKRKYASFLEAQLASNLKQNSFTFRQFLPRAVDYSQRPSPAPRLGGPQQRGTHSIRRW